MFFLPAIRSPGLPSLELQLGRGHQEASSADLGQPQREDREGAGACEKVYSHAPLDLDSQPPWVQ